MVKRDYGFWTISLLFIFFGIGLVTGSIAVLSTSLHAGSLGSPDAETPLFLAAINCLMALILLYLGIGTMIFACRRQILRQDIAQGRVASERYLANEQPIPDLSAISLPFIIRWRLRPSFRGVWLIAVPFVGAIVVGGIISPNEGFTSSYGPSLWLLIGIFMLIFTLFYMALFVINHRLLTITEDGLAISSFIGTRRMRWEEIRLWSFGLGDRYILSSAKTNFGWTNPYNQATLAEAMAPPETLGRLNAFIAAKTTLPLYRFEGEILASSLVPRFMRPSRPANSV
jgi:hypothetical protein